MNFGLSYWLLRRTAFFAVGILAGCDIGRLIIQRSHGTHRRNPLSPESRCHGTLVLTWSRSVSHFSGTCICTPRCRWTPTLWGLAPCPTMLTPFQPAYPLLSWAARLGPSQKPFKLTDLWMSLRSPITQNGWQRCLCEPHQVLGRTTAPAAPFIAANRILCSPKPWEQKAFERASAVL